MTVTSIETVKAVVEEDPEGVIKAYKYTHAVTGNTLYSIEHASSLGSTLASEYVSKPSLIYDKKRGWFGM